MIGKLSIPIAILLLAFVIHHELVTFTSYGRGQNRGIIIWREALSQDIASRISSTDHAEVLPLGYVRKTPTGWLVYGRVQGKQITPIIGEVSRSRDGTLILNYRIPVAVMLLFTFIACAGITLPFVVTVLVVQTAVYRAAIKQVMATL